MQAKTLSCLTLDEIAANGRFDIFARNCQTQTWVAKIIGSCQKGQIAPTDLTGA